ncbi:uncharacterized protein IL334_004818 [Kwoniella shivajii]|uniref:Uncharacterized protein n=1 Tax=Kwoniella shivajii TaxID=564305 RepID=A0ABZ1D2U3_9TREE|nr:hypothetical protein IL334_004818 [Kwoniella shivajii]
MSNCVDGPTFVEQVLIRIIDQNATSPDKKVWEGCISAVTPLGEIFDRWVQEKHPGSQNFWYRFTLGSPDGPVLSRDDTSQELGIHTLTTIYAKLWARGG